MLAPHVAGARTPVSFQSLSDSRTGSPSGFHCCPAPSPCDHWAGFPLAFPRSPFLPLLPFLSSIPLSYSLHAPASAQTSKRSDSHLPFCTWVPCLVAGLYHTGCVLSQDPAQDLAYSRCSRTGECTNEMLRKLPGPLLPSPLRFRESWRHPDHTTLGWGEVL